MANNPDLPEDFEERKKFYKMLLTSMSMEEKIDELWHLPAEDLRFLSEQFVADEDYEICQAIKATQDERNSDNSLK